jgi:hypothetical protein
VFLTATKFRGLNETTDDTPVLIADIATDSGIAEEATALLVLTTFPRALYAFIAFFPKNPELSSRYSDFIRSFKAATESIPKREIIATAYFSLLAGLFINSLSIYDFPHPHLPVISKAPLFSFVSICAIISLSISIINS